MTTPLWAHADVLTRVPTGFFGSGNFLGRIGILGGIALTAFAVLTLRLWSLQELQGGRLLSQGVQETTRVVTLPGSRGTILDTDGRVLAGTAGVLDVTADPQTLGTTTSTGWRPTLAGEQLLHRLGAVSDTSVATLVAAIRAGIVRDPYGPVIILSDVSEPLAAYLSERADDFRGVSVTPLAARSYPQGALGGTFLGLIGQLSPSELESGAFPWAKAGETVGQSGVEATYDQDLNGGLVRGKVRVDSSGREVSPAAWTGDTRQASTLQLTISSHLQRVADQAIAYGIKQAHLSGYPAANAGAAIVMNPNTGAIEALASSPELNQAAAATKPAYLSKLLADPGGASPLFDRATQGLYPLGSTFKPVVAEAALTAGLITPTSTLQCTGALTVGGIVFHNDESWIDAALTLPEALEISCDTWFYQLGEDFFFRQEQGKDGIQSWANQFGFGRSPDIDIPGAYDGVVPTPAWLEKTLHEQWYEGDSVNLSIGQGFLEATPLQLAVAYAALANGGTIVRPHVGEAVISDGQRTALSFPPLRKLKLRDLSTIQEGLYLASHGPTGTSTALFGDYPVAVDGKTGTAQVGNGNDDSWYASWAPANHPKVVVIVLIQNGGYGADAAAPAAKQIYNAIFHIKPQL